MILKRLEISGFKSFAKAATLEFPAPISSIVGPNGSGKSNVADSIRWVLGEQSMKTLRGKKGEDLIFAGTAEVSKMGKASVSLVFDNTKKIFPVEFDEVIISRRVYRDGVNEYLLNGSVVRLKDIFELLSRVGLGASQHHIIAQGDADRILYASPLERKSMISEALGLKIFEVKKQEAERKIEGTEENIKHVESLRRELQPHLKYLHLQAEKAQSVSELRVSLEALSREYVGRELASEKGEHAAIAHSKDPLQKKIGELERTIKESEVLFGKEPTQDGFFLELKKLDQARDALLVKRRELERESMRQELEMSRASAGTGGVVPKERVRTIFENVRTELESAAMEGTLEAVRTILSGVILRITDASKEFGISETPKTKNSDSGSVDVGKHLRLLRDEEAKITAARSTLEERYHKERAHLQKESVLYRERSDALGRLRDELHSLAFLEEKLDMREKEFKLDFEVWLRGAVPHGEVFAPEDRDAMRKKIERFRIRLEEAGGVDEGVLKEFEETKKRDAFLATELEDLKKTAESLKELFKDLEGKIEKDFATGLAKINDLFGHFFHEIFGGGKATIKIVTPKKQKSEDELEGGEMPEIPEEEAVPGIEIMVDIPRKRIKSLSMLSGGERALVSIALLFAMSTVNPPPFLVLDETDAALDEANSRRYAAMLQELGKKTQLLVITHNRETMKAANVLYGVTMGKNGISSLLSIKFEDAEDVLAKR